MLPVAGALHPVVARGIDRCRIFQDPTDKRYFIEQLAEILKSTQTRCFAWAIIANHFHMILTSAESPILKINSALIMLNPGSDIPGHREFLELPSLRSGLCMLQIMTILLLPF